MLEDLYISLPKENIRKEVLKEWAALAPGEDFGILPGLTADYLMMTDGRGIRGLKPVMLLMCGDHGICKYGVSAFPQEVTLQMINGYGRGTAGANVMARHAGADIVVVDVGTNFDLNGFSHVRQCKIAWGTDDFTQGPAMTYEQAVAALETGMRMADEAIDGGCNLLETGEMGIANTTSTAAIAAGFLDLPAELTVGRGSGINDERLKIKTEVVRRGLEVNKPKPGDGRGRTGCVMQGGRLRSRGTGRYDAGWRGPACSHYGGRGERHGCRADCVRDQSQLREIFAVLASFFGFKRQKDAGSTAAETCRTSLAISILRSALDTYRELAGE